MAEVKEIRTEPLKCILNNIISSKYIDRLLEQQIPEMSERHEGRDIMLVTSMVRIVNRLQIMYRITDAIIQKKFNSYNKDQSNISLLPKMNSTEKKNSLEIVGQ